jgi:hypothetical protein
MAHEVGSQNLTAEGPGIAYGNCMGKLLELCLNLI